jgi:Na+-transporting methylmalonyl-CoA/oxaloacetate decarboxylase gamma subunit
MVSSKIIALAIIKTLARLALCYYLLTDILKSVYASGSANIAVIGEPFVFLQLFFLIALIVPTSVTINPPMEVTGRMEEEMKRANDLKEQELQQKNGIQ